VVDLCQGLSDGHALAHLLEAIASDNHGNTLKIKVKEVTGAGATALKLDNLNTCFSEMDTLGIRTTGNVQPT